ncbi:MAG: hypothetical protein NZ530_01450 [Thermodesulfobacteriaceae bacterium]|nr:hypothetical protein [Thermodesulfobacteriaceae bacterium]MDW8135177.1 hypothetical protein [Thermodesulfobacterium sp.]
MIFAKFKPKVEREFFIIPPLIRLAIDYIKLFNPSEDYEKYATFHEDFESPLILTSFADTERDLKYFSDLKTKKEFVLNKIKTDLFLETFEALYNHSKVKKRLDLNPLENTITLLILKFTEKFKDYTEGDFNISLYYHEYVYNKLIELLYFYFLIEEEEKGFQNQIVELIKSIGKEILNFNAEELKEIFEKMLSIFCLIEKNLKELKDVNERFFDKIFEAIDNNLNLDEILYLEKEKTIKKLKDIKEYIFVFEKTIKKFKEILKNYKREQNIENLLKKTSDIIYIVENLYESFNEKIYKADLQFLKENLGLELDKNLENIEKTKEEIKEFLVTLSGKEYKEIKLTEKAMGIMIYKELKKQKVLSLLGDMLKFWKAKRFRLITPARFGITFSDDLERLYSDEFLKMTYQKKLFVKDFYERNLKVYPDIIKEKAGYGAFVMCIDVSASMLENDNISKAKAIALFYLIQAIHKNIPFILTFFNVQSDFGFLYYKRNFYLVKKGGKKQKLKGNFLEQMKRFLEAVSRVGAGGGTNYYKPLSFINNIMEKENFKGDLLFITDGIPEDTYEKEKMKSIENRFKNRIVVLVHIKIQKGWDKFFNYIIHTENENFTQSLIYDIDELRRFYLKKTKRLN